LTAPSRPLRVVHVIPQIGIGGAEGQLRSLIERTEAERARHEVLFYADSLDQEGFRAYAEAGIEPVRIPRSRRNPLVLLRGLAREIRMREPDVVHCWLTGGSLWGRWAAFLAGAPTIVVSFRNCRIDHATLLRALGPFEPRAVHYLANSHACARAAAEALRLPETRFRVIHNGIELERYRPAALRPPSAERPWTVVMVGRLTAQKNHAMLLRIARRSRGALPVRFVAVGHGELHDAIVAGAHALGLEDVVEFAGLRRDVPAILGSADLFLFTSWYEGFPNAVLEAMAAGLPIICTDFAGADELIESGINGTLVPRDDDEAAFRALARYAEFPDEAARHAQAARRSVEERFTMERMVESTLAFYASCVLERA